MGELARTATRLPDALVRLLPDRFQVFEQQRKHAKIIFAMRVHAMLRVKEAVQHFSVDIELHLVRSGISNAYRTRVLIAWQPANLPFQQLSFALESVHDLNLI